MNGPVISDPPEHELEARFGPRAPSLLRAMAITSFFALVSRLLSVAVPGSRSGIEAWIRRCDFASSLFTQANVLVGSGLIVVLVMTLLGDRDLNYGYRLIVAPLSAIVLMMVLIAVRFGLEPTASLALGVASLVLATAGASAALRTASSRAQGLVLSLVVLATMSRLLLRVATLGSGPVDAVWASRLAWIGSAGHAFDAFGVALAAARLRSERRGKAALVIAFAITATGVIAWGALRGSDDGASTWQVILSRALAELTTAPVAFSTPASRTSVEVLAVLLAGVVALWPGRISNGMVCIGLALTVRHGADVPASALVLAAGALAAPLGTTPLSDALREKTRSLEHSAGRANVANVGSLRES